MAAAAPRTTTPRAPATSSRRRFTRPKDGRGPSRSAAAEEAPDALRHRRHPPIRELRRPLGRTDPQHQPPAEPVGDEGGLAGVAPGAHEPSGTRAETGGALEDGELPHEAVTEQVEPILLHGQRDRGLPEQDGA